MNPVDLVTGKLARNEPPSAITSNAISFLAIAAVFVAGIYTAQTERFQRVKSRARAAKLAVFAVPP